MGRQWKCRNKITTAQKGLKDKRKEKPPRKETRRQIRRKKMQNLKQEKVETNKKRTNEGKKTARRE